MAEHGTLYPEWSSVPDVQSYWAERTQTRLMSPNGRLLPVCRQVLNLAVWLVVRAKGR